MPILEECGKTDDHEEGIAEIVWCCRKLKGLPHERLGEVIKLTRRLYKRLLEVTSRNINNGLCEDFALDVIQVMRDAWGFSRIFEVWGEDKMMEETGDEWTSVEITSHCFIEFRGRYYDSETPGGVDDWKKLPCFKHDRFICRGRRVATK